MGRATAFWSPPWLSILVRRASGKRTKLVPIFSLDIVPLQYTALMWQFHNICTGNVAKMSDDGDHGEMEDVTTPSDFFDHIPSKQEKIEVGDKKMKIMEL